MLFGRGMPAARVMLPVILVVLPLIGCETPTVPGDAAFAAGPGGGLETPSGLSAVPSSATEIVVSWRDNSPNETRFEVYRSPTGEAGTFTFLGAVVANTRSYLDPGLSSQTRYCYQVRALRESSTGITYSAFSNTACATTPPPPPPPSLAIADSWAYTEAVTNGYGQVCHDTGTFVFTATSTGFIGTAERTGNCVKITWFYQQIEPPGTLHPVENGIFAGTSITFDLILPRPVYQISNYAAQVSGNPPDRMSGTVNSGSWWIGTWEARRRPAVASINVLPGDGTIVPGNTRQLLAIPRASDGLRLIGRTVTWSSGNAAVATVTQAGLVSGLSPGSATITATIDGRSTSVQVTVETVRFASIELGWAQSCGITTLSKAYCWGYNGYNGSFQLGDGTAAPAIIGTGLSFSDIAGGYYHTCGVATTGAAYCWGQHFNGALGNGSAEGFSSEPVAVAGGISFAAIAAGYGTSCGLTGAGVVYCWGNGVALTPVASPGPAITQFDLATSVACGLTAAGSTYCWGTGGSMSPRADGLVFTQLSVGSDHTCGLDQSGVAWCWGLNQYGQLGVSPTGELCEVGGATSGDPIPPVPCSTTPVSVASPPRFVGLSAGMSHSCGLDSQGAAWCWGYNLYGQLGNGTTVGGPTPVAVAGGLRFTQVSAGSEHSCGLATDGMVYCWGLNGNGQLGTGTTASSLVPVRVIGQ